jgi:hypothetical protein
MSNNFSKPTTFRIKPSIMANFKLLENVLRLNKTEILDLAITNLTENTLIHKNSHPLAKYIGSISSKDAESMINSIKLSKKEQNMVSLIKDKNLESAFE